MKKYIDRDALAEYAHCQYGMVTASDIMEFPTADVQPVKHGKWIEKKVSRMKWIPYADDDVNPDDVDIECMTEQKCSYCKRWTIKFTYHIELDYCPLCGARMDGDTCD